MPRHSRRLSATGIYHVMFRGVNRDSIFLDIEDHVRFLDALGLVKKTSGCAVLAYCLMPNHAHVVLRTDGEPIGQSMKRLGVRYAGWFNRKYGRVGHVFQDRFRSVPVEDDAYFITLIRYVWNNPVRGGMVAEPTQYPWNSCAADQPPGLVDSSHLDDLLPSLAGRDLSAALPSDSQECRTSGPKRGHTEAEVARLLEAVSGVRTTAEFGELVAASKKRAISDLRTRSVSYAAIAVATGLSRASVQRLHARGTAFEERPLERS